jgi:hypothetical protein
MVFLNTTKQLERLPSNCFDLSTLKSSSSCADIVRCVFWCKGPPLQNELGSRVANAVCFTTTQVDRLLGSAVVQVCFESREQLGTEHMLLLEHVQSVAAACGKPAA